MFWKKKKEISFKREKTLDSLEDDILGLIERVAEKSILSKFNKGDTVFHKVGKELQAIYKDEGVRSEHDPAIVPLIITDKKFHMKGCGRREPLTWEYQVFDGGDVGLTWLNERYLQADEPTK